MAWNKDEELQAAWRICHGSPSRVAEFLGVGPRTVYLRRARLEKAGVYLQTIDSSEKIRNTPYGVKAHAYTPRRNETIKDGWILIASDCHFWPGESSRAHQRCSK